MSTEILANTTRSALKLTEKLATELEEFVETGDRKEVLNQVRELFIARRAEASSKSEEVRAKALDVLVSKLDTMPAHLLIRVVEMLTEVNQNDLAISTGNGMATKGGGVVINNNMASLNAPVASPSSGTGSVRNAIQDGGDLLEALSHIGNFLKVNSSKSENLIDITPVVVDNG